MKLWRRYGLTPDWLYRGLTHGLSPEVATAILALNRTEAGGFRGASGSMQRRRRRPEVLGAELPLVMGPRSGLLLGSLIPRADDVSPRVSNAVIRVTIPGSREIR